MVNSRVKRQLEQNQISPRTLQSFRQQLPKLHEYATGSITQKEDATTGRYHFRYISVPAPLRLYAVKILATNFAPGLPGSVASVGAALYKPLDPVPADGVDMSGAATGLGPELNLIEASTVLYSASSFDSTAGDPAVPGGVPTSWGTFYFPSEPLLLPGNDYYLCFSVYGGAGTFCFWTDSANPSGWYTQAGSVPADNSFPKNISPLGRGAGAPACVLQSKHGLKRTGYRIS